MKDQLSVPDILHFEKRFRKMIYDVQRNTKELYKLEKEQLLLREELYSKELLLQNERRVSNDLRTRLKLTTENITRLEEEKMQDKMNYSNLSINYDNVFKERDSLAKEALLSQTETTKLKIKVESLESTLKRERRRREELEKSLMELKIDNEKIISNIDLNITKISREQKYLMETTKATIQFNKRLQTLGLCFHAIHLQNKGQIQNLREELNALSAKKSNAVANDKLHPEIEYLSFKIQTMLEELKSKMQTSQLPTRN